MATAQTNINEEGLSGALNAELNRAFENYGATGVVSHVQLHLSEWKSIPLNIAITGSSGTGKSSFINAIRGMTADDEGAAPVGVTETTQEPTPYPHPKNKNLKFWDLPGVGTPNFPREKYVSRVNFEKYDFFLIFSAGRFTSDDLFLANQVQKLQKKYYFIRTKINLDIENDKQSHPRTHSRQKVLHSIRENTLDELRKAGFNDPKIFLIDNYKTTDFDFGDLNSSLMQDTPALKKEAMAFSLTHLTENIIMQKKAFLEKRIFLVAISSAVAGALPVPGVGMLVDITVLLEEAMFYRRQLKLDDESFEEISVSLKTSADELKDTLNLNSKLIAFTATGLLRYFASLGISSIGETILSTVLPLIGSLIAASVSYATQVYCLRSLLNALVDDSLTVHRYIAAMTAEHFFG